LKLSKKQADYLRRGRVGRLATIDGDNLVHLVPIVYACIGDKIYFVVDRKKKQAGKTLKRIRNISENAMATLLIDNYSEDGNLLSYLMIHCRATIVGPGESHREKELASKQLKEKYPQYGKDGYFPSNIDKAVFVKLEPQRAIFWQNLHHSVA
jgi:PPOX class probable F420-dependent enzyme